MSRRSTDAAAGVLFAALAAMALGPAAWPAPSAEPQRIAARQATLERNPELRALVEAVHREADAVVLLAGGGATPSPATARKLRTLLQALSRLAAERRIVVGDSGVGLGLAEAAGRARRASGGAFRLVGVAPARAIAASRATAIDAHHSQIVAVDDPALPAGAAGWGTETATMYWLFNRFAEGRNSVAIVAGGGEIALREVAHNVEFGRPIILVEGSGGAADAMVTLVRGAITREAGVYQLQSRARTARLHRRPDLFRIVSIDAGAAGLLEALRAELGPVLPRMP